MSLIAVQRSLARFGGMLETTLSVACGGLLIVIFGSVFAGVVVRYVSMVPWSWTEEVARFCLVWFAPMAAAIGVRRGSHFAFEWMLMPMSPGSRRLVRQLGNVLILAFLVLMLRLSFGFLEIMENQTSFATEIDMRIPASGLVVGFGALILMHALELADAVLSAFTSRRFSLREQHETIEIDRLESEMSLIRSDMPARAPAE